MSYCARGDKTRKTAYTTPATKTVNPPAPRDETCGPASSEVITGGGSSSENTVYVPGPPGPQGPIGENGWGFLWEGEFALGTQYYAQETAPSPREHLASVVEYQGSTWIAVEDNISTTEEAIEHEPGVSASWELVARKGQGFDWRGEFTLNEQYYAQSDTQLASVVEYMGSSWIAVEDNISVTEENPEYEPGVSSAWELVAQKGEGSLTGEDKTFFDSLKDDIFDWFKNATLGEILAAGLAAAGIIWAGTKIIEMITDDGEGDGDADQRFNGSDGYVTTSWTPPDIKDVIEQICEVAGVDHDASELPDQPCLIAFGQNTSGLATLKELSLVYLFDIVSSSGTLRFVPRDSTPVKTLDEDDIGFKRGAETPTDAPFTVKRIQGITLPRSVTLNYVADDTDYNPMTQTSQMFTFPDGQDVTLSTSAVLTHEQAKKVTELALMQAHIERTQYQWNSSYAQLELETGDVIDGPFGAVRIDSLTENDEGVLLFEGTDAGAAQALDGSNLEVAIPPASTNIPVSLGYSQAFWIDPPNLNDSDKSVRVYAAVHGYGRAGWPGAQIYVSRNDGASYDLLAGVTKESTVGLVSSALASADYHQFDNTTTISVQLKTGELASVAEIDVLNGKNWCMIGQEILGFKTATLTAPKTYTLSGLLRGRQGTEQFVGTHVSNELFVLLDGSPVEVDLLDSERNKTYKYKVVTVGSSLDKVDAEDVQVVSNNKRLWTVHGGKVLKIGSDFQISYKERIRYQNTLRDGSEIIHDDDWAGFGIAIMDGSTVLKTYTTTSEVYTYTAAQQTADFGSTQSTLTVQVVQMSKAGAPGYPVTLTG